jgi:hypothetical protein
MENKFNKRTMRVLTSEVEPNPWNPNRLTPAKKKALAESLEEFSDLDFILVRPHPKPTKAVKWQIVDGENRYLLLVARGETEIDVVVAELGDAQAMKYTLIANEHGENESDDLANLLLNLEKSYGTDLHLGLMIPESEVKNLVELGRELDQEISKQAKKQTTHREPDGETELWLSIHISVPSSVAEMWKEVKAKIAARIRGYNDAPLSKNLVVANGQVLEFLMAEYLASEQ